MTENVENPQNIQDLLKKSIQVKKSDLPENWNIEAGDLINKMI